MSFEKTVEDTAVELLRMAVTELPKDVKEAIHKAYGEETSAAGKTQLKAIIDNFTLAKQTRKPMCQDTGTIIFYLKAGADFKNLDCIKPALIAATRRATSDRPQWRLPQLRLLGPKSCPSETTLDSSRPANV